MEYYIYTRLVECKNYKDFEDTISGHNCIIVDTYPRGYYYHMVNYCKIFKGFDSKDLYDSSYPIDFLCQIAPVNLVRFLGVEFDAKTKTVTYFESAEKRSKGVRSNPTKMGKFFRKIAPYFNDKQIEFLVNYTVSLFTASVYEHKIARGGEITEIYLSKAERGRNVGNYSCINASCMRYDDWEIHPTEVYATESWELHYLTNEEGDIGARALVCKEDNTYSYIYASCEYAGDVLGKKLEDLGFTDCQKAHKAFDGAKLLRIEGNGGLVAPYIDYHNEVKDCGDYLQITYRCPDYSFGNAGGYVDCEVYYECNSCGRETRVDSIGYVDGETYCEGCTFFCEHSHEYAVGEPTYVYHSTYTYYSVCEDALGDMGAVYNENDDEWQTKEWYEERTKEDEEDSEDEIEPKKEIAPGVKCIVLGGYNVFHFLPIGTVVEVVKWTREGVWDCRCVQSRVYQTIETKDLVVVG